MQKEYHVRVLERVPSNYSHLLKIFKIFTLSIENVSIELKPSERDGHIIAPVYPCPKCNGFRIVVEPTFIQKLLGTITYIVGSSAGIVILKKDTCVKAYG